MKLGQRVKFKGVIHREDFSGGRRWQRYEASGEGILVGLRTFSNGEMVPELNEWSGRTYYIYERRESVRAAIVATHLRHKPVYVLVEDLEVVE